MFKLKKTISIRSYNILAYYIQPSPAMSYAVVS